MRHTKRSTGFILTTLCTFALLLAAGGLSAFSFAPNHAEHGARLITETPGAAATMMPDTIPTGTPGGAATEIPATATPGGAATEIPTTATPGGAATGTPGATTNAQGTYIGTVPNATNPTDTTWVALNSHGNDMTAFVTDGSKDHPATFAHWYKGTVQDNKFAAQASQPNAGKLDATVTQDTATGTITLPDGKMLPFTADVLQAASSSAGAGLYKSEKVVNGKDYVSGWVLAPNPATAPPTATETPSATETPAPVPTLEPSPSVTLSPTATPSISGIMQGGGMYDTQTNTVSSVPELTLQNLQSKQVTVPNLGELSLVPCTKNGC
ncbi:MAG: hypothetical protein ABI234_18470 [Ktedonobacteraceae bacterium]